MVGCLLTRSLVTSASIALLLLYPLLALGGIIETRTIFDGSQNRYYVAYLPDGYENYQTHDVLFLFHDSHGDAYRLLENPLMDFRSIANSLGLVLLIPNSLVPDCVNLTPDKTTSTHCIGGIGKRFEISSPILEEDSSIYPNQARCSLSSSSDISFIRNVWLDFHAASSYGKTYALGIGTGADFALFIVECLSEIFETSVFGYRLGMELIGMESLVTLYGYDSIPREMGINLGLYWPVFPLRSNLRVLSINTIVEDQDVTFSHSTQLVEVFNAMDTRDATLLNVPEIQDYDHIIQRRERNKNLEVSKSRLRRNSNIDLEGLKASIVDFLITDGERNVSRILDHTLSGELYELTGTWTPETLPVPLSSVSFVLGHVTSDTSNGVDGTTPSGLVEVTIVLAALTCFVLVAILSLCVCGITFIRYRRKQNRVRRRSKRAVYVTSEEMTTTTTTTTTTTSIVSPPLSRPPPPPPPPAPPDVSRLQRHNSAPMGKLKLLAKPTIETLGKRPASSLGVSVGRSITDEDEGFQIWKSQTLYWGTGSDDGTDSSDISSDVEEVVIQPSSSHRDRSVSAPSKSLPFIMMQTPSLDDLKLAAHGPLSADASSNSYLLFASIDLAASLSSPPQSELGVDDGALTSAGVPVEIRDAVREGRMRYSFTMPKPKPKPKRAKRKRNRPRPPSITSSGKRRIRGALFPARKKDNNVGGRGK